MEAAGVKLTEAKKTASELVSSGMEAAGTAAAAISRETGKLPGRAMDAAGAAQSAITDKLPAPQAKEQPPSGGIVNTAKGLFK